MSEQVNRVEMMNGDTACPGSERARNGIGVRDYFAARAMSAMIGLSIGEDRDQYDPKRVDADFEAVPEPEEGRIYWYQSKGREYWYKMKHPKGGQNRTAPDEYMNVAHRCVGTYEQRLAREAYEIADAMLAARKAGQ